MYILSNFGPLFGPLSAIIKCGLQVETKDPGSNIIRKIWYIE